MVRFTQTEDAKQCLKALGVEKYDWMIVDHYALDKLAVLDEGKF